MTGLDLGKNRAARHSQLTHPNLAGTSPLPDPEAHPYPEHLSRNNTRAKESTLFSTSSYITHPQPLHTPPSATWESRRTRHLFFNKPLGGLVIKFRTSSTQLAYQDPSLTRIVATVLGLHYQSLSVIYIATRIRSVLPLHIHLHDELHVHILVLIVSDSFLNVLRIAERSYITIDTLHLRSPEPAALYCHRLQTIFSHRVDQRRLRRTRTLYPQ